MNTQVRYPNFPTQLWHGRFPNAQEMNCAQRDIQALNCIISRLAHQQQFHINQRNRRVAFVSSWTTVFTTVFELVLEEHLGEPSEEGMKQLTNLRLVCRLWNWIALSTPRLWSSLVLKGPFSPLKCSRAAIWLGRSKSVPKAISIVCLDICPCGSLNKQDCILGTEPLAELLRDGMGPLGYLSLTYEKSLCIENLQRLVQETPRRYQLGRQFLSPKPWDTITTLSLNPRKVWKYYADTYWLETLPPTITRLKLIIPVPKGSKKKRRRNRRQLDVPISLPERLTHFTYSGTFSSSILEAVSDACHNLQALYLHSSQSGPSEDLEEMHMDLDNDTDAHFPHLRSLGLHLGSLGDTKYLRSINAPYLQSLTLSFVNPMSEIVDPDESELSPYPDTCIRRLINLIDRSQCRNTLTHLRLERVDLKHLYPLLARLTSLTDLVLRPLDKGADISGSGNWLFEILHENHTQERPPLPALRFLSFLGLPEPFYLDNLKRWREERRKSGMAELTVTDTKRGTVISDDDSEDEGEDMEI